MTHHTNPGRYQSSVQAPLRLAVASHYNIRLERRTSIFQGTFLEKKVRLVSRKIR